MDSLGREVASVRGPDGANVDRRRQESREERFERTKREIGERLQRHCPGMSSVEFDEMVTQMAEVQIKYTLRRSADLFPEVVEWERGSVDFELPARAEEVSPGL
jgi:hypothetical protein